MESKIFNLIKTYKFDELKDILLSDEIKNLNFHDENNNYLIHYLINYNQLELFKKLLEKNNNIRLDIIDNDGKTILYQIIKYSNNDILESLLKFNKVHVGFSIIDNQDKLGYTALHYAIILNNFEAIKILLQYESDIRIKDNEGNNSLQLALINNKTNIFIYLLEQTNDFDVYTNTHQSLLHLAISKQNIKIIDILLEKNININAKESDVGASVLQFAIVINNFEICKKLINKNIDINLQDYSGDTALMQALNEETPNIDIIDLIINTNDIDFNISNIEGDTALHKILSKYNKYKNIISKNNFEKIIKNTDLLIQNNRGNTIIHLLLKNELFIKFENILIEKELNIFINNLKNESCFDFINNDIKKIKIVIDSYYNILLKNKSKLNLDWEIKCSNKKDSELICKKKINDIIFNEKRSIPHINNNIKLNIDNGIFVNFCYYTGSTIDIICGMIFLYKKFSKLDFNIILNEELSKHDILIKHYESLGIDDKIKLELINFEIIWCFQKIIFPTNFDESIKILLKTSKYISIPIGIETSSGSHANILLWDVKNKIIERFEPYGKYHPRELNYNPKILDMLLFNKFKKFDENIKYLSPYDFLPIVGFQILEISENNKCKRIGDPNGFCGVWCTWWVYQRMSNPNILPSILAIELIKQIKLDNYNFKTVIRNFSSNITIMRDNILKSNNIDINDWITSNYKQNVLNNIEKDLLKLIKEN
jgi:ankyrin repeat protein